MPVPGPLRDAGVWDPKALGKGERGVGRQGCQSPALPLRPCDPERLPDLSAPWHTGGPQPEEKASCPHQRPTILCAPSRVHTPRVPELTLGEQGKCSPAALPCQPEAVPSSVTAAASRL